jgi:hypothetical protein
MQTPEYALSTINKLHICNITGHYSLVSSRSFPPFAHTERGDDNFNVDVGSIMNCLGPHFRLSGAKDRYRSSSQAVSQSSRTVCETLLTKIDCYVAEFVLPSTIRTKAAVVQNLDSRGLYEIID